MKVTSERRWLVSRSYMARAIGLTPPHEEPRLQRRPRPWSTYPWAWLGWAPAHQDAGLTSPLRGLKMRKPVCHCSRVFAQLVSPPAWGYSASTEPLN